MLLVFSGPGIAGQRDTHVSAKQQPCMPPPPPRGGGGMGGTNLLILTRRFAALSAVAAPLVNAGPPRGSVRSPRKARQESLAGDSHRRPATQPPNTSRCRSGTKKLHCPPGRVAAALTTAWVGRPVNLLFKADQPDRSVRNAEQSRSRQRHRCNVLDPGCKVLGHRCKVLGSGPRLTRDRTPRLLCRCASQGGADQRKARPRQPGLQVHSPNQRDDQPCLICLHMSSL